MTTQLQSSTSSRRGFLRKGCLTAAAVGLTVCGGAALAATYQPNIDFPTISSGDDTVNNRTLIAYASKAGSTAEIAAKIGETITKQGQAVDVLPVAKVTDLSLYSAVILGSAIRVGQLLPEAMKFLQANQAALAQKKFSAFIVCMTLKDDTEANRQTVSAYLDPVRALVKPASEGLFAGVMDLGKLPLFERLMIKMMKAPEGDFRKWDAIQAWAGAF
ncbi:MAG: flavodoxin [Chloroflexi bacterium]|nr:MAG: flavodoxin [Chloroflexota bacterium]